MQPQARWHASCHLLGRQAGERGPYGGPTNQCCIMLLQAVAAEVIAALAVIEPLERCTVSDVTPLI